MTAGPPFTTAAFAVHDDDFTVARQGIVLQAIIAHDDVAARIDQQLRCCRTIAADRDRHPRAARKHDRFIADGVRIIGRLHQLRAPG
jgi:hypothetical protein